MSGLEAGPGEASSSGREEKPTIVLVIGTPDSKVLVDAHRQLTSTASMVYRHGRLWQDNSSAKAQFTLAHH